MSMNQKTNLLTNAPVAGLAMGWVLSMGITLLGSMALSFAILNGTMEWNSLGYGIMVLLLLSSFFGASFAAKRSKGNRMAVCILSGVLLLSTLLGITLLLFGGQYEATGITAVLIAGGSVCAGLVHCAEKKPHKVIRRKIRL